ncbi:MAG: hypothetical protein J7M19_01430 [Planctomycetes bacterium]|nr:hypothetical protein [Planctomycetota bacterium]
MLLTASASATQAAEGAAALKGPDAPASALRLDDWKVIGPGGGGTQYIPTISPHDTDRVLVRCDMTGSYISNDGGNTWRMFNLGSTTRFFVFDPVDPNVIYAKNVGLFRSTDAGETWNLVHPRPADVTKFVVAGDHAGIRIVVGRRSGEPLAEPEAPRGPRAWGAAELVTALAVDPADSRTLYAAISAGGQTALCVSTDWGETWKKLGALPGGARKIFVDPHSPKGKRKVYVIGHSSVSVCAGGQWTHHRPPRGVTRFADVDAGFPAGGGALVVYAVTPLRRSGRVTQGGVQVSTNGGRTWRQANNDIFRKLYQGAPAPRLRAVATCRTHPEVAYLSYSNLLTGRSQDEHYLGVAKTTDGGGTWELVWKDSTKPGDNMKGAWLNERFGPWWGENPGNIGVAPTDPDIVYGTDSGRTMRTTDGGKTWQAVYSRKAEDGSWTTTGLDVTTCYGVHFDPFEKNRVFISYTDIGLFSSDNGGSTWKSATAAGVPRGWVNTTYWMVFDPEVRGRVWAVMSGVHDLPRPKMWRGRGRVRNRGGVCISADGGRTWKQSTQGMPETAATHILMDPTSPADARVLYVTGFGTGVWKSTDGGKSWTLKNNGIQGQEPFAWRLARDPKGVLYLVVARKSESGEVANKDDGALYRSTDGAETWEKVPLPEGLNGPNDITVDPEDPSRLYLAAWGRFQWSGAVMGGIYLSTDAGKTWQNVLAKDQYIYAMTVDRSNPNTLYACGFGSSAWRSDDRGETWTRIAGYNFKWGHRVIPDPYNPGMIYVATFGGSVWYGPANGDQDAVEDIVTPVAKPAR